MRKYLVFCNEYVNFASKLIVKQKIKGVSPIGLILLNETK